MFFLILLSTTAFFFNIHDVGGKEKSYHRCQVYVDQQHIYHFKSEEQWDLYACLGYAHGKERAFQMEYFRRVAQGRMAELLGRRWIRSDFFLRLMGLPALAERLYREMPTRDKTWLQSYSRGVNQGFFEEGRGGGGGIGKSYQFKELATTPRPWKPQDSLMLFLLQSLDQTKSSFSNEIKESKLLKRYSPGNPFAPPPPWETTILKKGEYPPPLHPKVFSPPIPLKGTLDLRDLPDLEEKEDLWNNLLPFRLSIGSNSWVLAPSRSHSKKAWLANDPHLANSHPPFWFWAHLEGDGVDAIGATSPGLPAIPSGLNRHVAWGLTNSYVDVADIALIDERELKGAKSFRPVIYFDFFGMKIPFFFKTFRRTKNGFPILPIAPPPSAKGKAYVLKWSTFLMEGDQLSPLYEMLHSQSVQEMDRHLANLSLPTWNYVFADTKGHIGYRAMGLLPYRTAAHPLGFVQKKTLAEFERPFQLFRPGQAPHLFNPKRGHIVIANNKHWGDDAFYSSGHAYGASFRASRIEKLIKDRERHTFEDLRKMQCDTFNSEASYLLPLLLAHVETQVIPPSKKDRIRSIVKSFRKWNFYNDEQCLVCGVYRRWMSLLIQKANITVSRKEAILYNLLKQKRKDVIVEIIPQLLKALDQLSVKSAKDLKPWGQIHQATFPSLGGKGRFPAPSLPTPGDKNTVNVAQSRWRDGRFDNHFGASQRLLVELSTPPRVWSILPGPQRDIHPRDPNKEGGPWMKWKNCQLERRHYPVNWEEVESVPLKIKFH